MWLHRLLAGQQPATNNSHSQNNRTLIPNTAQSNRFIRQNRLQGEHTTKPTIITSHLLYSCDRSVCNCTKNRARLGKPISWVGIYEFKENTSRTNQIGVKIYALQDLNIYISIAVARSNIATKYIYLVEMGLQQVRITAYCILALLISIFSNVTRFSFERTTEVGELAHKRG